MVDKGRVLGDARPLSAGTVDAILGVGAYIKVLDPLDRVLHVALEVLVAALHGLEIGKGKEPGGYRMHALFCLQAADDLVDVAVVCQYVEDEGRIPEFFRERLFLSSLRC